jgi:RNA polymerase sigma-70 factor (ECF subfamily)
MDAELIADDHLRLIFTCCHPALTPDQQVALALREICGLTTEQIAAAFFTRPSTLAQRIVRAKNKIRDEAIPYVVPEKDELPARLEPVLRAIYLVYNEGYSAPGSGVSLAQEAIRLGRLIAGLVPDAEALGLLALMLYNESRRAARTDGNGDIVLLAEQDRELWDGEMIAEANGLLERSASFARTGPFRVQAVIAGFHARAASPAETDWTAIAHWYGVLQESEPWPIVALNRAVAIGERDGPEAGLRLIEALIAGRALDDYHLAHAARAEFCRRLDRLGEARSAYARALELARDDTDRRFLRRRLTELG